MKVGIAYATPQRQVWLTLDVPVGSTIGEVIAHAALTASFPDIDLEQQKVGVFGKLASLDTVLADGDRVEVYRSLTVDPKSVKRRPKATAAEAEPA